MKQQDPRGGRDHQQRLNLGPCPATLVGSLYGDEARDHRAHQVDRPRRRAHDIACGQVDIGNALADGLQDEPGRAPGGRSHCGRAYDGRGEIAAAVVHMASLPLTTNILTMTIMATKMPFVGRG